MKLLKFLMFILMAITILSCYSSDPDCGYNVSGPIFWESISNPFSNVQGIAVANNGDVWISTSNSNGRIFLSTNDGNTWIPKGKDVFFTPRLIAISPINGYIFAGGLQGLFRSTDNGENWVQLAYGMRIYDIIITPSGEIYIVVSNNYDNYETIYYSNNNGDTWIEKHNGSNTSELPSIVTGPSPSLTLGKDGTLYALFSNTNLYRSTDGGDTWLSSSNYDNIAITRLTISDDGSIFAAAGQLGVLKSTDRGVIWNRVNNGLGAEPVNTIIYNPITKDLFVSTTVLIDEDSYNVRIYRSTDLGTSWQLEHSVLSRWFIFNRFAVNPKTGQMYVACHDNYIYRLRNYP